MIARERRYLRGNLPLKALRFGLNWARRNRLGGSDNRSVSNRALLRSQTFKGDIDWVFDRTACLGSDVLKLAFPHIDRAQRFHLQKVRIDRLADHIRPGPSRRRNLVPLSVRPAIAREDVWGLVYEQNSYLIRQRNRPVFCLVDSYSELTDQRFIHTSSGSYFYANYSDVSREALADGSVVSEGLLDLDNAMQHYEKFFSTIEELWGRVPIFLLSYPRDLEVRQKFLDRGIMLEEVFERLANTYENVRVITGPLQTVRADHEEIELGQVFPYHYDNRVKEELARNLLRACRDAGVSFFGSKS